MKLFRTILLFACALVFNSAIAQNLMNIHQGNGTLLQIPLDWSNATAGSYSIILNSKDFSVTKKLIKK